LDDVDRDIDFQPSFADFPRITDADDLFDAHEEPLESSLFDDLSRSSMPQFGASLINDQPEPGFLLSGPRHAATRGFSFQTSSSSSSSLSTGLDGRIHEQVMQSKSQRGGNGQASKGISATRICMDGDCHMKTVESTAPTPGVEFVEGVSMRGPQGGALDKRMSLMLGMDDGRRDQIQKRSSVQESDDSVDGSGSEPAVRSRKNVASLVPPAFQRAPGVAGEGRGSSPAIPAAKSRSDRATIGKTARNETVGAPAGNEIIMLVPSDEGSKISTDAEDSEEGQSEPEDEV